MAEEDPLGPIEIRDGNVYGVEARMCMEGRT